MATRYGSFGIGIDGSELGVARASEYEAAVKWHLDLISHSSTGSALLQAIQRTGKRMAIKPWKSAGFNATASPLDPRNAGARAKPIFDGSAGTGEGSAAEIRYSPDMWGFGGSAASTYPATSPGAGRTAVLFHEMAHGYRQMNGHWYKGPLAGYDDEEELFAILLSNIFVTDPSTLTPGRTLRADHQGFNTLAAALSTSKGFLQNAANRQLVLKFTVQEPGLTNALRNVNASFNPIKEEWAGTP